MSAATASAIRTSASSSPRATSTSARAAPTAARTSADVSVIGGERNGDLRSAVRLRGSLRFAPLGLDAARGYAPLRLRGSLRFAPLGLDAARGYAPLPWVDWM